MVSTFSVSGVHNLLTYLGVNKLPLGVSTIPDRYFAFNVSDSAKLFSPLKSIYPKGLPEEFSVLMTMKFHQNYSGYFLTLSDLVGKQRFALRYAIDSLYVQYFDQHNNPGKNSPQFDVDFLDNSWHQIALSVSGNQMELYIDCDTVLVQDAYKSKHYVLGANLMLALGPYFARYGPPFEVRVCFSSLLRAKFL